MICQRSLAGDKVSIRILLALIFIWICHCFLSLHHVHFQSHIFVFLSVPCYSLLCFLYHKTVFPLTVIFYSQTVFFFLALLLLAVTLPFYQLFIGSSFLTFIMENNSKMMISKFTSVFCFIVLFSGLKCNFTSLCDV